MVIFPKVLNHIEVVVVDLVEQVDNQANHVPAIVGKTICSLNFCRKKAKDSLLGAYNFCMYELEAIFRIHIQNH